MHNRWPDISKAASSPDAEDAVVPAQRSCYIAEPGNWLKRWLVPSLSDWFFIALLVWLFMPGGGWYGLLADGDTGWHIRAGEFIVQHHELPRRDLFSFSKPNQPWYAWEWLAAVAFSAVWRWLGLKGLVLFAGTVIVIYLIVLFRHLLWRGANVFIAITVCMLVTGASNIHFLARPHIFTLLGTAVSLWILDADRRKPGRAIWALVPLTALWTNLHAGFLTLLVSIALYLAGGAAEALLVSHSVAVAWKAIRRYALLEALCTAATLLNPYGAGLHRHLWAYLRSDWIRNAVDEFQSPKFRSENALYFEILLFAGLIAAASLLRRRNVTALLMIVAWAHAALVSVRHVPLFAIVVAPVLASEATVWWEWWTRLESPRSVIGILNRLAADVSAGCHRLSAWPALAVVLFAFPGFPGNWPRDFPEARFPVTLITRNANRLSGVDKRIFTSDLWGGYLLYRFYPDERTFIDGRSDFYGPDIGKVYLRASSGNPGWQRTFDDYRIAFVLAPKDWALEGVMRQAGGWRVLDEDSQAVLFGRTP